MSQKKPVKRKVMVSTEKKLKPTTSRSKGKVKAKAKGQELIFNRENYKYMILGVLLVVIGLFLMAGGKMPDRDTWDPDLIYSFRRTVLAPIVIIAGLLVEVYAIFKK